MPVHFFYTTDPLKLQVPWISDCETLRQTNITVLQLTSKFMEMGGLVHFFLSLVLRSSISALNWHSFIPPILLILQSHMTFTWHWWRHLLNLCPTCYQKKSSLSCDLRPKCVCVNVYIMCVSVCECAFMYACVHTFVAIFKNIYSDFSHF